MHRVMNRFMHRPILFLVCLLVFAEIKSQQKLFVEISERSEVNIQGTSNVVPFRFTQKLNAFTSKQQTIQLKQSGRNFLIHNNEIKIPVKGFESENNMALRDFKKLLNIQKYPNILLNIKQLCFSDCNSKSEKYQLNIPVEITIANQSKLYYINLDILSKNQTLNIKASKRINIKDFGLEPPVTMMGLIKVSEWIEIQIATEFKFQKI